MRDEQRKAMFSRMRGNEFDRGPLSYTITIPGSADVSKGLSAISQYVGPSGSLISTRPGPAGILPGINVRGMATDVLTAPMDIARNVNRRLGVGLPSSLDELSTGAANVLTLPIDVGRKMMTNIQGAPMSRREFMSDFSPQELGSSLLAMPYNIGRKTVEKMGFGPKPALGPITWQPATMESVLVPASREAEWARHIADDQRKALLRGVDQSQYTVMPMTTSNLTRPGY